MGWKLDWKTRCFESCAHWKLSYSNGVCVPGKVSPCAEKMVLSAPVAGS